MDVMQENQNPIHFADIKKLYSKKDDEEYNPLLGIEVEKIGLYYEKATPPTYGGKRGYLAILGKLYEELGWEIVAQQGKKISSMKRGNAYLHLESDGRIELAGSPHDSIHDLAREMRIHQNEIKEISDIFGIVWLGCGYHPFASRIRWKN
jgi:glutamate--cysteine ligase